MGESNIYYLPTFADDATLEEITVAARRALMQVFSEKINDARMQLELLEDDKISAGEFCRYMEERMPLGQTIIDIARVCEEKQNVPYQTSVKEILDELLKNPVSVSFVIDELGVDTD